MRCEREAATVVKDVRVLRAFLSKLASHGVVPPMTVPFGAGGARSKVMTAPLDPATRLTRLPSARAIGGLADSYRAYAVREWDQIMAAVAALHVATGLRTIEILTLPYDCVVTDRAAGERQYGLRYSREDPRSRQLVSTVRTLTPMQARIALPAVRRFWRLTALARAQARLLERSATSMTLGVDRAVDDGACHGWRTCAGACRSALPEPRGPAQVILLARNGARPINRVEPRTEPS